MELREINTFLVAAEKMNFSKSAEQLGYTQEDKVHFVASPKNYLTQKGLYFHPYLEIGNTDLIRHFVLGNKGVPYLPLFIIEKEIKKATIAPMRIPEFEVSVYCQLFWHKDKYITKPMSDFLELVRNSTFA